MNNESMNRTVLCVNFCVAEVYAWAIKLQSRVQKDGATFQVLETVANRLLKGLEGGVMTEEFRTYGNIFMLIMAAEDTSLDLSSFAEHRLRCALGGITTKVEQQEQEVTKVPGAAARNLWNAYGGGLASTGNRVLAFA